MRRTIWSRLDTRGRAVRLILIVSAVVLVIVNGALALAFLGDLHQSSLRADRSLQIMIVLKQVEDLAEASGQSQRRYRLTGDAEQLDAYRKAQMDLPAKLARLRELVTDDSGPFKPLESLTALIDRDRATLAAELTPVAARFSDGRLPQALAVGADRTNAISAAVDAMLQHEQNRLRDHFATIESRAEVQLWTGTLVTSGAIAALAVILAVVFHGARKDRELAAAQSGALEASEQRFRRVFDESPLGILLAENDSQRIVQANPAFCRMLGVDAEQITGQSIGDLVHIDDRELLSDAIRRGTGPDLGVEARYVTHSGAIAWVSVRLTQLSTSSGRPGLLLALAADVTREKRVEAELRQAQKMEAIGQLTGGIAHDFNNLLGVIIGNVEFLIDATHDEEQIGLAREILNSALSGADLTRRLLAFARRQTLQPRRIDLNVYLPNHIVILRRLLGESITIATTLADDLWPIRADPSQVGDALLNLAINARDAMPHGGNLSITTANTRLEQGELDGDVTAGDYVVLSVTDTGTGMPPEVLERVVEPFFTTKGPGSGSGLGLSMIFGFARQSGGHLKIASTLGQGTTVWVYLPRAEGLGSYEVDEVSGAPLPQGSESILLVDDNAEMRMVARRHLVSLGYRVSEAGSGQAALEVLLAGDIFDLLFTDVVMPDGMTGPQLAATARHLRPGMKVLFTTGYSRSDLANDLVGSATGAVIRKPYRRQELAVAVRATLEAQH